MGGGRGGDPWSPGIIRRGQEVLGRPAGAHGVPRSAAVPAGGRSPAGLGWAALRRHRPAAGGGRGACEVRRRRRGTELTFLAHAGAGAARSWRARGRSGPREPHIAPPARGRAGQGRAGRDCARRPARPGFTRVWRPALVPPLGPARKPMARRPLPRAGCLAPEGGRPVGGGEGLGPLDSGAPPPRLS